MRFQAKCEAPELLRAAQYMRMSTEHQQYSVANQSAALALYAAAHRIVVVRSFIDYGKSGICIKGRHALQELIHTVQTGAADFKCVLVYDVSRWGRFQDVDEAAHYEYVCKGAGIRICYCAEPFENDNSMLSGLLKTIKRIMAGEYSRELSAKVFAAQSRLARMGFNQGGAAVYGLRRLLVNSNLKPRQILGPAEHKAIQTDRVVFVPGPEEETEIVRQIFDWCTVGKKTAREIALELNQRLLKTTTGKPWLPYDVRRLIKNPKYMGTYVYAQRSRKLGALMTTNVQDQWIIKENALPPLISATQFAQAQVSVTVRTVTYTDQQLLDRLREIWKKKGTLSYSVIEGAKPGPSYSTFTNRFGEIAKAFKLIGFKPLYDYSKIWTFKRKRLRLEREQRKRIVEKLIAAGTNVTEDVRTGVLTLNGNLKLATKVAFYREWHGTYPRSGWHFRINFRQAIHIIIINCLDRNNENIQGQYIIPKLTELHGMYWVNDGEEPVFLKACRSDSLEPLWNSVFCCSLAKLVRQ
jgi:DNA invertase Pin-like site-specific DNA recombinase